MAIAAGARLHGASLYQNTEVTKMDMRSDGTWDVITPKGTVHANRVVNCTGILTSLLRFDNSIKTVHRLIKKNGNWLDFVFVRFLGKRSW